MIEVIAKDLEVCPICKKRLQFFESACDFFVMNKRYRCLDHELVIAFPDQASLDKHHKLLLESR